MLHPFDDYPLHQTGRPLVQTATLSLDHYDRYFFNGYTRRGDLFFAVALGIYPNRDVIDAGFSVCVGGEQVSVLASGRAPADRINTSIGPIKVEIIEPMRTVRVTVTPAEGIAADLTFHMRTVAIEEPHFARTGGAGAPTDYTRLAQWGSWSGWINIDGERVELTQESTWGSRDRSWGVRSTGEPVGRGAPPRTQPQFFWLCAPLNFEHCCTHFAVNEESDGRRWHTSGSIVPLVQGADAPTVDPGGLVEPLRSVDFAIDWEPGTRRAQSCSIILQPWRGDTEIIRLEPITTFQMVGVGYGHPTWNHGTWHGEEATLAMRWRSADVDPTDRQNLHVQQLCRATWGGNRGIGVLEQLVLGEHSPTHLNGLTDGAS